jgi:photosynthetic reaction center cytochrome c subunit
MRRLLAVIVLFAASLAALSIGYAAQNQQPTQAQAASPAATPAVETAGQSKHFKNIQVLKDIPADQLISSMQFITAALGRDCAFCHVTGAQNYFASDAKPNKKTAREMMTMTMGINQNNFAGRQEVTCATCHQGRNQPTQATPIADEARLQELADLQARQAQRAQQDAQRQQQGAQSQAAQGASPANPQPAAGRPSPQAMQAAADEIIAKYVQAIGGDAAVQKLTSSEEKGTISAENGQTAQFEIHRKAPNKVLFVRNMPNGQSARVICDGSEAFLTAGQAPQAQPIHGIELDSLKLESNFYRNLTLKSQYTRVQAPPFPQKIDGKEVKVVQGILPNNQGRETLYFDPQSGLLVRRTTLLRTPLGPIAQQADYSDYRDVDGVKIPFSVRVARADVIQTRKVTEAKFNVPVDDSNFAMPARPAGAPGGQQ